MKNFQADKRAKNDTSKFNLSTWAELHAAWWIHQFGHHGIPAVLPLTPSKIDAVGCLLKASGYRSGYNYIAAAKDAHLAEGFPWDEFLNRSYRLFNSSMNRGTGPPRQSDPLLFDVLFFKALPDDPMVNNGPLATTTC